MAPFLGHEELERPPVVGVDVGERRAIDLVGDAPLAGLAELEPGERAGESGGRRSRRAARGRPQLRKRSQRLGLEVASPVGPAHRSLPRACFRVLLPSRSTTRGQAREPADRSRRSEPRREWSEARARTRLARAEGRAYFSAARILG